jgi:hypothetical protein
MSKRFAFRLQVFHWRIGVIWSAAFAITVVSEIYPFPLLPPVPFYSIWCAKLALFVILGYMTPLFFWRFNDLNRGVLFAAVSASFVEILQGVIGRGHSFHWYELFVKLGLILFGFIFGLDAVYEREITIGPFRVQLTSKHLELNSVSGPKS